MVFGEPIKLLLSAGVEILPFKADLASLWVGKGEKSPNCIFFLHKDALEDKSAACSSVSAQIANTPTLTLGLDEKSEGVKFFL